MIARQDLPWDEEPQPGDVLWSPRGLGWEYSWVRRVETVEPQGERIVITAPLSSPETVLGEIDGGPVTAESIAGKTGGSQAAGTFWEGVRTLDRFIGAGMLPETVLGLHQNPDGEVRWGAGDEFERLQTSWGATPRLAAEQGDPRIQLSIRELPPSEAAGRLGVAGWSRVVHRGLPIHVRYLPSDPRASAVEPVPGYIEALVHNRFAVTLRGNVDVALLSHVFHQIELAPLGELAAPRPDSVLMGEGWTPDAEPAMDDLRADSVRAAGLRRHLPYRVGGLPSAGRTVIHNRPMRDPGGPVHARGIWSPAPFDSTSPRILVALTDDRIRSGNAFTDVSTTGDWEAGRVLGEYAFVQRETGEPPTTGLNLRLAGLHVYAVGRNISFEELEAAVGSLDPTALARWLGEPSEDGP